MSISIVVGKPGSGKSYHITKYIAETLIEFARKGETVRTIFTNVSLNLDALGAYVRERSRVPDYDVSGRVVLLTDLDLRFDRARLLASEVKEERRGYCKYQVIDPLSKTFFWNRFPDDALIIVNEIQKYIGSVKEYGESESKSIVEYFSLHRHRRHDWIFLTQALTSLSLEVRKVSETVYEVFNAKMMSLPFPISIPMRDIEILLKGFGVTNQVYRVRQGMLEGSYKVNFDGPVHVVTMSKEIFALYSTHTQIDKGKGEGGASLGGGDSVLPFELRRGAWRRALWWFVKKHFVHVSLKVAFVVVGVYMLLAFIRGVMSGSWTGVVFGETSGAVVESSESGELPEDVARSAVAESRPVGFGFDDLEAQKKKRGESEKIALMALTMVRIL